MYAIIFYKTLRGEEPARLFIDELHNNVKAKVDRWLKKLEEHGPGLPRPFSDVLRDKIRELRVSHGRLEVRLLFFFCRKYIILTHGFLKKTEQTPAAEIERAVRYMNDFLFRTGELK